MDYNNNSDANFDIDNDGLVNVVDIIVLVEVVINHSNPSLIYDLNNEYLLTLLILYHWC